MLAQLERESARHVALVAHEGRRVQPNARLEKQDHLRIRFGELEQIRLAVDVVAIGDAVSDDRLAQGEHHRAHVERGEA